MRLPGHLTRPWQHSLICKKSRVREIQGSDIFSLTEPPSPRPHPTLVSHYSAIGDTISCDAPYSAIGFRGKLCLRYIWPVFGLRWAIFKERSGGVAAIVCDTKGNTVRQGYCHTYLAIGGGISVGSLSTQHPKTRQKPSETTEWNRKRTETDRNGSKWTFLKLSGVGWGFVGMEGRGGVLLGRKKITNPRFRTSFFHADFPLTGEIKSFRSEKLQNESSPNFWKFFFLDFAPNFAPNFPRIFPGFFVLRFVGNGDQKNFTKNPRHFSMQNSQANTKKIFTKFIWRAGKVKKFATKFASDCECDGLVHSASCSSE